MDVAEALDVGDLGAALDEPLLGTGDLAGVNVAEVGDEVGAHVLERLAGGEACDVALEELGATRLVEGSRARGGAGGRGGGGAGGRGGGGTRSTRVLLARGGSLGHGPGDGEARRLEGGDGVLEAHALDRAAARHGHDAADGVERGRLGDVGESEARHDLDEPRVFLSQVVNAPREVECLCHDVLLVWDATVRGPGIPGRVAGWRPLVGFRRQGYVSKARQTVVTDTFTKSYCETSI